VADDKSSVKIQPIVIDFGKNEWTLKQRDMQMRSMSGEPITVHEVEFLRKGVKYYRKVIHMESSFIAKDLVEEVVIPMTATRLPGPTNGALDLDPRDLWLLTGRPLPQFRSKSQPPNLEARLRRIIISAGIRLGPNFGQELVDILVDTALIGLLLTLIVMWIAAHCASGPLVVIPLIIDALGAIALGFTLGVYTWAFFQALWDFMAAITDGQTNEELDAGAEGLAQMIRILAQVVAVLVVGKALKALTSAIIAKIQPNAPAANTPQPTNLQPVKLTNVTEELIRSVMKNAPLKTQQAGGVSIPKLQRILNRWLLGETPPPIKVDKGIIIDGNHRYVVSRLLGKEMPTQPWAGGNPDRVVEWKDMKIDPVDWGD
jgi:hypothetical protein